MLLSVALAYALTPHGGVAPCGTVAMRESGAGPRRVRSVEPAGYDTTHFHIEGWDYTPTDEEYQLIGEIFEEVWAVEVDTYGYAPPYGEGLFSVWIEEMPRGLYGYTSLERDGQTAYVAISPDMSWTGLSNEDAWKVTAAHEFFHALQFTYDYWESSWWMEATSTWMEDEVYDSINDYAYYLGEGAWPDYPEVSMVAENGWHEYGEVIWPRYLSTFHGDTGVIKSLWEACVDQEILDATAELFGSQDGFYAAVVDFEVRNVLGYAGYEEGAEWYPVYTREVLAEGAQLPATVAPTEYYADYLGVNYWRVPLLLAPDQDLVVDFTGNPMDDGNTVEWQVTVVGTDGSAWDAVTATTRDTLSVDLSGFGTTWTEGWVIVGILSFNTHVDHDQYSSDPRYTDIPPTYNFAVGLAEPSPDDTGDTGGSDTGGGGSGLVDSGGEDSAIVDDSAADTGANLEAGKDDGDAGGCGCQSGPPGVVSGVVLALAGVSSRRRKPGPA